MVHLNSNPVNVVSGNPPPPKSLTLQLQDSAPGAHLPYPAAAHTNGLPSTSSWPRSPAHLPYPAAAHTNGLPSTSSWPRSPAHLPYPAAAHTNGLPSTSSWPRSPAHLPYPAAAHTNGLPSTSSWPRSPAHLPYPAAATRPRPRRSRELPTCPSTPRSVAPSAGPLHLERCLHTYTAAAHYTRLQDGIHSRYIATRPPST